MPGSRETRFRRIGILAMCLMSQRQKFCDLDREALDETVRKVMDITDILQEKHRFASERIREESDEFCTKND